MSDIDIRQTTRERLEMREYVTQTLRALIDWITATKPSEWLPATETKGATPIIPESEVRQKTQDWIDKSATLMDGAWQLPTLLRDDAIAIMDELSAKSKGTPETKP